MATHWPLTSPFMFHSHDIPSLHLGVTRRITVWLPPRPPARRAGLYPVLYLNDGQNLFDPARAFAGNTWRAAETAGRLIRQRRIPPLIIVGIDHGVAYRGREYLPVEDDRNPTARKPLGLEYAEFVTREVLPFVARNYPVGRGASAAGFGGSSYGAIAALNTVLVKPGVFGRLLLESASLYVGEEHLLWRARAAGRWPARVYLGVGTRETGRPDLSEETVRNVLKLEAILRRARLGPRRLRTVIEEGATHSESAWAARFPQALEFLFGR
jgi:predicted alpha/beta superfamily hydrolase